MVTNGYLIDVLPTFFKISYFVFSMNINTGLEQQKGE